MNTTCPVCGGPAKRETNTMPQWAGSCWYYLRYIDPHNDKRFVDVEKEKYWMPVSLYVGGAEHAVLHLLYSRFWHEVLFDLGLVSTREPFQRLVNQGMITSFAYQRKDKALVAVDQVEKKADGTYVDKETGEVLQQVTAKMSKSLKNVINPDEIVNTYGADSMRMYEMFMGPLEVSKPWSTEGLIGITRFLDRIWRLHEEKQIVDGPVDANLEILLNQTVKKVTEDTSTLNFNTAISQMMVLVNELYKSETLSSKLYDTLILLLSPYVPHLAEELWVLAGHEPSVTTQKWPTYDEAKTRKAVQEFIFQVNGKVRSKTEADPSISKDDLLALAKSDEKIKGWIAGKTIVKEIVVPGKLVNIVVK